jgi:soluble lytic murein transglycosylase-like protein
VTPLCTLYLAATLAASAHSGIPAPLLRAVIQVESSCRPNAVSFAGALGLAQVLPFWTRTFVRSHCGPDLFDPVTNLCYSAHILRYEFDRCRGQWSCALRFYSGNAPGYFLKITRVMRAERIPR